MSNDKTNTKQLNLYTQIYVSSKSQGDELEVVFGSRHRGAISRIDFENVISKLKSIGFYTNDGYGDYYLNIQNQFVDSKSGRTTIGNIRTTITGIKNIQDYCNSNTFDLDNPPAYIRFMQKIPKVYKSKRLESINYDDFKFRVNYKEEKILRPDYGIVRDLLQTWTDKKKVFRLIKRFSFISHELPVRIDCSIVRSSRRVGRRLIPEYRIESSNVFKNPESYEIEIEVDRKRLSGGTMSAMSENLLRAIRRSIKYVLSGLQESNFPISYREQNAVIGDYMHILYKDPPDRRVRGRDFVGPSSISLERPNIVPLTGDNMVANIRTPYTVTEKADGIRKLLVISKDGKLYMIDVNMRVQFTGTLSTNKSLYNTIIDGEHVLHNKDGKFINQYLAFDIYYVNRKDVRAHAFYIAEGKSDHGSLPDKYDNRLTLLNKVVKDLKLEPVVGDIIPLKPRVKSFKLSNGDEVFGNCKLILGQMDDDLYDYEVDGLIFTPANTGVGSNTVGEVLDPVKRTWKASFKWKPPEYNTIDFLVTTQKTDSGHDFVGNIFEKGDNMRATDNHTQYKTLILRVGFDERRHGYLNPCDDVIQDKLPRKTTREDASSYKPVPFYPVNPTPQYPAYICNIVLENKGNTDVMTTEDKEQVIEDETIVEFRYDKTRDKYWQWVPIRVRLDKTADYRSNGRNYGNAYHVAQSVWNSIHNPITHEMITTGEKIPNLVADDDVYYNRKASGTITRSLRDFHNLYVKRTLILAASKRGGTLIDMTVGKGGDFPKWIAARLSFVFGLDISRDNIENRLDGACARFLNYRKRIRSIPYALFVNANSGLNIRSTQACFTDKGKEITRAVFGDGSKDEKRLGKGVFRQYGKGADGFDVVSNQFSIHYFCENAETLNNFMRNVSECCKVGGYFIGTSYDGRKVFRALENKKPGESISVVNTEGVKMWEIRKRYNNGEFNNDISCLGYRIDVYQESINKTFAEYLVNYEYLMRVLENYGFTLLNRDEARNI